MASLFIAVRAAVFASAFIGFWFWVIGALRPVSRPWDAAVPAWLVAPGIGLAAAGAAGVLLCIALFVVHGRGTPALFDAPRRFVVRGPYVRVRNPMYISALALFGGFGLYWRSIAVLAFCACWFALIHAVVVLIEEPGLASRFGERYQSYRRGVPRWIPRWRAILTAVFCLSLVPLHGQAPRPDFTGTWLLDPAQSDYGPFPKPDRRIDLVDHRGPAIKVTRRDTVAGEERTGEWTCRLDGGECANTIRGAKMTSLVEWDNATMIVRSRTEFQGQPASVIDRWKLSADGRTLAVTRRASSPAGTATQTFVFTRQ